MKLKNLLKSLTLFAVLFSVSSCDTNTTRIGVLKFVNVPPLNDAYNGFVSVLEESNLKYKIDLKDANAEGALVSSSSLTLVGESDLVLGIATPAASGLLAAREIKARQIPILFTAVTDPVYSGLMDDKDHPDNLITGTSDMNPVREQIELFTKLGLDIKKIGMIYSSNETNSIIQKDLALAAANEFDLEFAFKTFSETSEISAVMDQLIEDGIEGLYTPTDSTLVSAYSAVYEKTKAARIPIIGGEEGMLNQGAVATLSINYFRLGQLTGEMAIDIINGKSISEMPVRYLDETPLILHLEHAEEIGLVFPTELLQEAKTILGAED